jgi:hypothetical protein
MPLTTLLGFNSIRLVVREIIESYLFFMNPGGPSQGPSQGPSHNRGSSLRPSSQGASSDTFYIDAVRDIYIIKDPTGG